MEKNILNELNSFLENSNKEQLPDDVDKEHYDSMLKCRDKIFKNKKLCDYVFTYAREESRQTGKPWEECFSYVSKIVTLLVHEKVLKLNTDE